MKILCSTALKSYLKLDKYFIVVMVMLLQLSHAIHET